MLLSEIKDIQNGRVITKDENFIESEHPRENDGKFTEKGGGKSGSKTKLEPAKMKNGKLSPVKGDKMPSHIAKLRIPPAWTDVRYNPDPKAELLVIGKDAKNRPQYIYSEQHWKKAEKSKFDRIKALENKFDKIKSENDKKAAKKTEEAIVLKLIMETGIRPGGEEDTGAKVKAYGATTLEGRHVEADKKGNVTLHFIGKKGVENKIPLQNPEVAKIIMERAKKAGSKGRLFNTDGITLLKYTATLGGGGFKTKDFRTLIGTKTAMALVSNMKAPSTEKEYKKQVKEVAKTVASKLGNTPAVALKSYISPVVFSEWRIS